MAGRKTKKDKTIGVVINCVKLNVRNNPIMPSVVNSVISAGTEVEILEKLDGWYKIPAGYVMAEFIELK